MTKVHAAFLLFATALPAQERQPLTGRVADAEGKPAASAVVTLFHTPAGDPTGATTDRVDVRTDERGRFVAQVLPRCGYSAFASGTVGAQPLLSEMRDLVAARGELELQLSTPARPRTIALAGTEAWQSAAPFTLCAYPTAANLLRVEVALQQGKGTVPPLPGQICFVVFDRKGDLLWGQTDMASEPLAEVEIAPPESIRVLVREADGTPVAGASVAWRTMLGARCHWYRAGSTAADGTAVVLFPASDRAIRHLVSRWDPEGELLATVPGRAARGIWQGDPDRVVDFTLVPDVRIRLTIDGSPLAKHSVSTSESGWWQSLTDAQGWLALHDGQGPYVIAANGVVMDGVKVTAVAGLRDLRSDATLDLARLRRLRVQVLLPDRGPAQGQPVFLLHPGGSCVPRVDPVFTDAAGRIELRLGTEEWLLFVCDGERLAWRSVLADDRMTECTLQLEPLPCLRLRVVDQAGTRVPGARVVFLEAWATADQGEDEVLSTLSTRLTWLMTTRISNRSGLLELPFLARPGASPSVTIGCDRARSDPVALRATDAVIDVIVR